MGVKGDVGTPIAYQYDMQKKAVSPFESSGSTSRYVLTEAIVKNRTFYLDQNQARFAAPDVVYFRNKFISIFTPGISFIAIPFYYVGTLLKFPQLITYLSTLVFALLNCILIYQLAKSIGTKHYTAIMSSIVFMFGTNALPYAYTLTQHHGSIFIILLQIILYLRPPSLLTAILMGSCWGIGLLFDIPNLILTTPIIFAFLLKYLHISGAGRKFNLSIKMSFIGLILGILPFVWLFAWYNYKTTGSYTTIGQSLGRSNFFEPEPAEVNKQLIIKELSVYEKKYALETRNQMHELFILLISNQRSWLYYSPIVLVGIYGLWLYGKSTKFNTLYTLVFSVILTNIVVYSLFGGLGGWSFGPRYLLPSAALLCSFIGLVIQKYTQSYKGIIILLIYIYSITVSILGAITSTQIPPKIEAINLAHPLPYTFVMNINLLIENNIAPLVYNYFFKNIIPATTFFFLYCLTILSLSIFVIINIIKENSITTLPKK